MIDFTVFFFLIIAGQVSTKWQDVTISEVGLYWNHAGLSRAA